MKRIAIVGGGIVGLATAWELNRRRPDWKIWIVEKEERLAAHQTGRNSGVIHSGIYYVPGSLKARTCLLGRQKMEEFCERHNLPWQRCGKVIVATRPDQLPGLSRLEERGRAHGLQIRSLTPAQLKEIEPACTGLQALHVPETGIVDYSKVVQELAHQVQSRGALICLGEQFLDCCSQGSTFTLRCTRQSLEVDGWINCAGLYSDKVARSEIQIVPFRGEYYKLTPDAESLCRGLIYPVPDPRFPFLGVHLTRHIDGSVGAGPNAVLALGRENYDGWSVNWKEAWQTLTFPGFQRLALRYWKMGLQEQLRSLSKRLFLHSLQELTPGLRLHHLKPAPSGIRAQAVSPDGTLLDDFCLRSAPGVVHVINAPSPAATASLAIAEEVVDRMLQNL